jgi:uncharacterized protein YndB with AHSA1/START domain
MTSLIQSRCGSRQKSRSNDRLPATRESAIRQATQIVPSQRAGNVVRTLWKNDSCGSTPPSATAIEGEMPPKSSTAPSGSRTPNNSGATSRVPALVIKRTFNAPRDLVWKAWSDPAQAKEWWGPNGFTLPFLEMDQRTGGKWRAMMRSPDGKDMWQHGVYREIIPPEKTVYTFAWDADPENETLVSVVFKPKGDKTEMTFTQEGFSSAEDREGHNDGWSQTFNRLATHLEKISGGRNAGR